MLDLADSKRTETETETETK